MGVVVGCNRSPCASVLRLYSYCLVWWSFQRCWAAICHHVKENLVVTVMLQQDMGDNEAQTLTRSIARCPYIKDIRFISKRDALKDAAKEMGANPASFTDGVNPFSSSIELTLKSDYANSDSLQWIAKDLKKYPKVSTISYQRDLIDAVNRNLAKIGVVLLVLAVLLTIVSFSLINNTVRLGIYARRFSIHTMKLVGLHGASFAGRSFAGPFSSESSLPFWHVLHSVVACMRSIATSRRS